MDETHSVIAFWSLLIIGHTYWPEHKLHAAIHWGFAITVGIQGMIKYG